jgi:hypothetical protein
MHAAFLERSTTGHRRLLKDVFPLASKFYRKMNPTFLSKIKNATQALDCDTRLLRLCLTQEDYERETRR